MNWKFQLTRKPKFMSSTDSNEKHMLHTKSNNIEVTINNFIQELFDLLLDRYQEGMEQSFIVRKGVPAPPPSKAPTP